MGYWIDVVQVVLLGVIVLVLVNPSAVNTGPETDFQEKQFRELVSLNRIDYAKESTLGKILTDTGLIESDTGDISSNTAGIETDTGNIETNTGNIDSNTDNLESLNTDIKNNTYQTRETLLESRTVFGEISTAQRTQLIDLVSTLGTSVLRDVKNTTGSANIPSDATSSGEIKLETGSTANSRAILETEDKGRYTPGQAAQIGLGVRTLEKPSGEQEWKAGYYDENSGFYFGENSTCIYIAELRAGKVEEKVCRSGWNGQNITEQLGRSWDSTDGAIYQIDYSWYGYGVVRFSIVETVDTSDIGNIRRVQKTVPVHVVTVEGNTSISDPIQPIRAEVDNGGTAENYELRIGGRQYSVIGSPSRTRRITNDGDYVESVSGSSFECIVAFQKSGTEKSENIEVKFQGIEGITNGNTEFAVFFNPNLTSAGSFSAMTNIPSVESGLRSNRDCGFASVSGEDVGFNQPNGTEIWSSLATGSSTGGGSPGSISSTDLNIELPADLPVAVAARSTDGSTVTVSANAKFVEKQ